MIVNGPSNQWDTWTMSKGETGESIIWEATLSWKFNTSCCQIYSTSCTRCQTNNLNSQEPFPPEKEHRGNDSVVVHNLNVYLYVSVSYA